MKTEMTARDRKLLIFLAVFVVVVGVSYWGIRPLIKSIKSIDSEIAIAEEDKEVIDYKVMQLPMMRADQEMLEEKLEKSRVGYYEVMSSDEVDKYLTGVMLDHGLYSYDLNFSIENEDSTLKPYSYSRKAQMENGDSWDANSASVATGIRRVSASMRVGGTEEQIQKLIDDLSVPNQKLLLKSYEWEYEKGVVYNNDGTYEIVESRYLKINLELFMLTGEE
ncbi:MAG: hypothetical protein MJ104_09565 [Lachnospiraceae bacterium]|nr:hypothetical protein [Lachnospiraceae bacterium]